MRRVIVLVACLAVLTFWGLGRPHPVLTAKKEITLLVYNIHGGFDVNNQPGLDQQLEILRRAQADVVILNEVDRNVDRSGRVDQVRWFAERLNYSYAFGPNVSYPPGEYGNAILSRYPIVSSVNHRLPMPTGMQREPRGALEVVLDVGGIRVTVMGTHFGLDPKERSAYADYLVNVLAQCETPFVLGGDFNSVREWGELETLWQHYRDALDDVGLSDAKTFSAHDLRWQLDHVFLWDGLVASKGEIWSTPASDHLPIYMTIRLP